jgi:TRAP-type C4-dicarboxylate transport system permease small subunit
VDVSDQDSSSSGRAERSLAFMIAATLGLSVLAFLALIIGTAAGVRNFGEGMWPVVIFLPLIGLPIGFVLMLILLVLNMRRRLRTTRGSK